MDVTGCGNRSKRAGRDNRKRRIGLLGNYDGIPGGYLECQATPVTQTWHGRVSRSHVSSVEEEEKEEGDSLWTKQQRRRRWNNHLYEVGKVEEWSRERANSNVNRTLVRFAAQRRSHRRRTMADRTFRLIPGSQTFPERYTFLDRWGVAAFSPPEEDLLSSFFFFSLSLSVSCTIYDRVFESWYRCESMPRLRYSFASRDRLLSHHCNNLF